MLPFRIQDVRRQLEIEGDLTFEALSLLRTAEDERRGIQYFKIFFILFLTTQIHIFLFIAVLLEKCREIRQELISETETIEEDKQHQEEITSVTTDSGKGTDRLINLNIAISFEICPSLIQEEIC